MFDGIAAASLIRSQLLYTASHLDQTYLVSHMSKHTESNFFFIRYLSIYCQRVPLYTFVAVISIYRLDIMHEVYIGRRLGAVIRFAHALSKVRGVQTCTKHTTTLKNTIVSYKQHSSPLASFLKVSHFAPNDVTRTVQFYIPMPPIQQKPRNLPLFHVHSADLQFVILSFRLSRTLNWVTSCNGTS